MEHEEVKGKLYRCCLGNVMISDELLAEFDRLKLKVAELAADLWDARDKLKDANLVNKKYWSMAVKQARDANEAQAENEELKVANTCGAGVYEDICDIIYALQSHLDTICEPIRTDGDIGYIKRTVIPLLYEQCKTISAQTLEGVLAYLDSQKKPRPADSHKKPPNHAHSDGSGSFWEGKAEDCPICNPKHLCNDGIWEYIPKSECQRCNPKCEHKNRFRLNLTSRGGLHKTDQCQDCGEWLPAVSLTQCPECIWGQKIVYVNGYIVPVFVEGRWDKQDWVYERCPRCKGGGRISC